MPVGTILAYVGSLDKIPSGWYLCDGANGTPDLRDRFLEGAGTTSSSTMISPGLPNITGQGDINYFYGASGAFKIVSVYNTGWGYVIGTQEMESFIFDKDEKIN